MERNESYESTLAILLEHGRSLWEVTSKNRGLGIEAFYFAGQVVLLQVSRNPRTRTIEGWDVYRQLTTSNSVGLTQAALFEMHKADIAKRLSN